MKKVIFDNLIYFAIFLTDESKKDIKTCVTLNDKLSAPGKWPRNYKYENEFGDHVTLAFKPDRQYVRDILPFMGRCDLVAEIDGDLWMLDYKTSRQVKDDQRISLQLSIYTWLWNETHDRQIDRMGAVWLIKDYAGAKPSPSTQLLHEFMFDPSYVKSAYGMFKRFYDGFDLNGSPKTKLKVPKKFKLEL